MKKDDFSGSPSLHIGKQIEEDKPCQIQEKWKIWQFRLM